MRHEASKVLADVLTVSIHAPREGCDKVGIQPLTLSSKFQFTHPVRGATTQSLQTIVNVKVSIHAPREGCDLALTPGGPQLRVSIHAPREGCDLYYID